MDCDIEFVDSATVTWNPTVDGDGNVSWEATAACDCPDVPEPCTVAGGGITGTQSGLFVDACEVLVLPNSLNPEQGNSAANFPLYWRQVWENPRTGETEVWVVTVAADGQNQWEPLSGGL